MAKTRAALIFNSPTPSRYDVVGEKKAALGVIKAVKAVRHALIKLGYDASLVPLLPPLEQTEKKLKSLDVDLVFNLFEGFCGQPQTEALIPRVLSGLGLSYTGCSAATLKLTLDKAGAKRVMKAAGIATPDFQILNPEKLSQFRLDYPCIVKPCEEDASHGLDERSVVSDFLALKRQVVKVSQLYGGEALVEEFICGREFNITVMGNRELTLLPISEIVYSLPPGMPNILTFAAKWGPDSTYFLGTKAVCPAKISTSDQRLIAETATTVFNLMGCRGYARVDMRMDNKGQVNVIEVNPNPDISPDAGAVLQAGAAGMTYTQFIKMIVQLALEKN